MRFRFSSKRTLLVLATMLSILQASHLVRSAQEKLSFDLNALPSEVEDSQPSDSPSKQTLSIPGIDENEIARRKRRNSIEYKTKKARLKRIKEGPPDAKVILLRKGRDHLTNQEYIDIERQRMRDKMQRYLSDPEKRERYAEQRKRWYVNNRQRVLQKMKNYKAEAGRRRLNKAAGSTLDSANPRSSVVTQVSERIQDTGFVAPSEDRFTKRSTSELNLDLNKSPPPSSPTLDPLTLRRKRRSAYQAERRKRPGIREKEKKREAKYYKANYDAILDRSRQRYARNRDTILARKKEQRERLPKYQAYANQRNYYYRNREKLLQQSRDRYQTKKALQKMLNKSTNESSGDPPTMRKRAYDAARSIDLNVHPPAEEATSPRDDHTPGLGEDEDKSRAERRKRRAEQVRNARKSRIKRVRESNPDDKVILLRSPFDPESRPTNKEYMARLRKADAKRQARHLLRPGVAEEKRARDRRYYSMNRDRIQQIRSAYYIANREEITAARRQKRRQKKLERNEAGKDQTKQPENEGHED